MLVMGTNTWDVDIKKGPLVKQALKFAEDLKSHGVAELLGAWIAEDQKIMWCSWKTENLEGMQAAFNEMNKVSGLKSKLTSIEDMCA